MNVTNLFNEYARLLPYYDRIPKTVLAAIAVSYASRGGDCLHEAAANVAREWATLYQNGIVPQKPPADVRRSDESVRTRHRTRGV